MNGGYLYICQTNQHVGFEVYKFGETTRTPEERFEDKDYKAQDGVRILFYSWINGNIKQLESEFLTKLRDKFGDPIKGREYFLCNYTIMRRMLLMFLLEKDILEIEPVVTTTIVDKPPVIDLTKDEPAYSGFLGLGRYLGLSSKSLSLTQVPVQPSVSVNTSINTTVKSNIVTGSGPMMNIGNINLIDETSLGTFVQMAEKISIDVKMEKYKTQFNEEFFSVMNFKIKYYWLSCLKNKQLNQLCKLMDISSPGKTKDQMTDSIIGHTKSFATRYLNNNEIFILYYVYYQEVGTNIEHMTGNLNLLGHNILIQLIREFGQREYVIFGVDNAGKKTRYVVGTEQSVLEEFGKDPFLNGSKTIINNNGYTICYKDLFKKLKL